MEKSNVSRAQTNLSKNLESGINFVFMVTKNIDKLINF